MRSSGKAVEVERGDGVAKLLDARAPICSAVCDEPDQPPLGRPHPGKKELVCAPSKEELDGGNRNRRQQIAPGTKVRCGSRVYTGQCVVKVSKRSSDSRRLVHPNFATAFANACGITFGVHFSLRAHARARSFVPAENLSAFDSCSKGPDGCSAPLISSVLHPRQAPPRSFLPG